ncbi:unnamed protein product [Blepharisma stoltei]|uniref:Uncharacterized protein n=1 Tax=Blepharisma stoltei TaxID=1481888 RepID=A0AAU9JTE6_9CILI|nr:unnamed protein product [Blepharisma stoltei]
MFLIFYKFKLELNMTSFKIPLENLAKNSYKYSYARSQSARCRSASLRNPILQSDEPDITPRSLRGKVPGYMDSSRWLNDRPKGKALAKPSTSSTYNILSSQDLATYKPTKRIFAQENRIPATERSCIRLRPPSPAKNPILQADKSFENIEKPSIKILDSRPSQITEYSNMRKSLTSSELGLKKNLFAQRNPSRIFDQEGVCDPFGSHRKMVDNSKQSSVSDLLSYKYALQYRENKVTGKI